MASDLDIHCFPTPIGVGWGRVGRGVGGGGGGGGGGGVESPDLNRLIHEKKVREKSRECHNHKPQPFPEEEKTDKTKQARIEQTYEKHED